MAISFTSLAAAINTTDATSFNTAPVDTTAHYNKLITIAIMSRTGSGDPNTPTLSAAHGLSIVAAGNTLVTGSSARLSLWRACIASGGSSGNMTIDFAGQTQTVCAWELLSWSGTGATAANNGSDGVTNGTGNGSGTNGTSISVTLAALQSGSAVYGADMHSTNENTTQGSGLTEITDLSAATPATAFHTEWKLAGQTTVDASWTTNSAPRIIRAIEILTAPSVGADTQFVGAIPI